MKKEKIIIPILALLGLSLMYYTASLQPEKVKIQEIDREKVGDKLTIEGEVKNVKPVKNTVFFTLEDGKNSIPAVTFRENLLLYEGLYLKASGKVTIHKGKTGFVLNRIIQKN